MDQIPRNVELLSLRQLRVCSTFPSNQPDPEAGGSFNQGLQERTGAHGFHWDWIMGICAVPVIAGISGAASPIPIVVSITTPLMLAWMSKSEHDPGSPNMPGSATLLNRPVRQTTAKAEEICVVILRRGTHRGPVDDPSHVHFWGPDRRRSMFK